MRLSINFASLFSIFVFCFTLCGNLPHASAVPVSIGDSVTWGFTLPSFDPLVYPLLSYSVNASAPPPGLYGFNGTISIYDDLSTPPVWASTLNDPSSSVFAPVATIVFQSPSDPIWLQLTDDPTSYLRIDLTGLSGVGGASLSTSDFNPNLYLSGQLGVEVYESHGTPTPHNPVPEPTTMLLFGAGLVGLAGFGRKKFKK